MQNKRNSLLKALPFAFKQTIPVAMGYIFLGTAFGILMNETGYGFFWTLAASVLIYAGSMQFVLVSLLAAGAPLYTVALMTLFINGRHIFYGLGFIEKFRRMGKRFLYMVLSLTDETYSVLCALDCPAGVDEGDASFLIALLDHSYWVFGSVLGALLGKALPFDMTGIDFSMTALFVVIFVGQWKQYKSHIPALTGLMCALISLVLLGPDRFLLPALAAAVTILVAFRRVIERAGGQEGVGSAAEPDGNSGTPSESEVDGK